MSTPIFPFTAIVGQDALKQALILNAIDPGIGGVLIRGEKGTAKSTLARGLAALLPPIRVVSGSPFQRDPDAPPETYPPDPPGADPTVIARRMRVVTLPVNATEDRVMGTLDLEHALQHGERRFELGLLAAAHRGILYVDEVNLLDDHLVDLLLDVAAMGVNTVEREGISFSHPARFMLVGTMNPEEGDLRPQLLDRFGLCVDVEAIMDVEQRIAIVQRRLAWDADSAAFAAGYDEAQTTLAGAILAARARLPEVTLREEQVRQAAQICVQLDVRTHRADIVMARAAKALAAWHGRPAPDADDIKAAALLALPHRMRRRPFEETRLDPGQIDAALDEDDESPPDSNDHAPDTDAPARPVPGDAPEDQTFDIGAAPSLALPDVTSAARQTGSARGFRRKAPSSHGRYTRSAVPEGEVQAGDVALDATLRAAAPHQSERERDNGAFTFIPDDVRVKVRERAVSVTVLLVVDASGSMGADQRMTAAKGATLRLLQDAYLRRCCVGLLAFKGHGADVLLPPTDSVELAHQQLKDLPTGGRTPLWHGLACALDQMQQMRRRDPQAQALVVLISDGKANVPYDPASSFDTPHDEAIGLAQQLVTAGAQFLVLDTERDFLALGLARKLAEAAGADYVRLSDIEDQAVAEAVRYHL
ncbi:MAG: VWA domain-containing protein [Chloroflexi bacterium]|nr:VWA domain-containing protein [Chloroflexota bacterium]